MGVIRIIFVETPCAEEHDKLRLRLPVGLEMRINAVHGSMQVTCSSLVSAEPIHAQFNILVETAENMLLFEALMKTCNKDCRIGGTVVGSTFAKPLLSSLHRRRWVGLVSISWFLDPDEIDSVAGDHLWICQAVGCTVGELILDLFISRNNHRGIGSTRIDEDRVVEREGLECACVTISR